MGSPRLSSENLSTPPLARRSGGRGKVENAAQAGGCLRSAPTPAQFSGFGSGCEVSSRGYALLVLPVLLSALVRFLGVVCARKRGIGNPAPQILNLQWLKITQERKNNIGKLHLAKAFSIWRIYIARSKSSRQPAQRQLKRAECTRLTYRACAASHRITHGTRSEGGGRGAPETEEA